MEMLGALQQENDINEKVICDICSHHFTSRSQRNLHILNHFEMKTCTDCDKNLLRIGDDWYELHVSINCQKIKCEPNDCHIDESCWAEQLKCDDTENIKVEESYEEIDEITDFQENSFSDGQHESINEFKEQIEINFKVENTEKQNNTHAPETDEEVLVCDICKSKFKKIENLLRHMDEHNRKKFKCSIAGCSKAYAQENTLKEHMEAHSGTLKYECNVCHKRYLLLGSLRNHEKSHKIVKFKCDYCKRLFDTEEELTKHSSTHVGAVGYLCDICNKKFTQKGHLTEHFKVQHMEKKYKCPEINCGKAFAVKEWFDDHMNFHNGQSNYACEFCEKTYAHMRSLRKHEKVHKFTELQCIHCPRSFNNKSDLREHILTHSKAGPSIFKPQLANIDKNIVNEAKTFKELSYTCDVCQQSFDNRQQIKRHMESHTGKEFKCSTQGCWKEFSSKIEFVRHLNAHKGIMEHQCELCGKQFSQRKMLNQHRGNHKKEAAKIRRYCTFKNCKRSYYLQSSLDTHMLVHDPTAERFHCQKCEKWFVTKDRLDVHQLTHIEEKNFVCTFCPKTFKSRYCLWTHTNIHTAEREYKCNTCNRSFLQRSSLKAHQFTHTGLKPLVCDIEGCDRAYSNHTHLKRHKFSVHGIFTKKFPCSYCDKVFPENVLLQKHMKLH